MLTRLGVGPEVLKILGEDPEVPYSIVADMVGVTRERVRQIAQRNGFPSRIGKLKPKICPVCGATFYLRNIYCSPVCRHRAIRRRIVVSCNQCGKPIERTPGKMRSKSGNYFCNRKCFGKWLWEKSSSTKRKA